MIWGTNGACMCVTMFDAYMYMYSKNLNAIRVSDNRCSLLFMVILSAHSL